MTIDRGAAHARLAFQRSAIGAGEPGRGQRARRPGAAKGAAAASSGATSEPGACRSAIRSADPEEHHARGEEQRRKGQREGAPVARRRRARVPPPKSGPLGERDAQDEDDAEHVGRHEEHERLLEEAALRRRRGVAGPRLEERIDAEARIVAAVRQQEDEDVQQEGRGQEQCRLSEELHGRRRL